MSNCSRPLMVPGDKWGGPHPAPAGLAPGPWRVEGILLTKKNTKKPREAPGYLLIKR